MQKIRPDEFAQAFEGLGDIIQTDAQAGLERILEHAAKDGAKLLKKISPKGYRGKYRRGWYATKQSGKHFVANTEYRLVHLLEHGHAVANSAGKRTRANPHVVKAAETVQRTIDSEVRKGKLWIAH